MFVRNQAKISLKFTDKVPFFADLSVSKTHFTDKRPFLTILSVNGSDFVKCSTRSISTLRRDYGQMEVLGMFVRKILLYIGSSAFSKKIKFKVWLRLLKL